MEIAETAILDKVVILVRDNFTLILATIGVVISVANSAVLFSDRRPRLKLKGRSKLWYHLKPDSSKTHVHFMGTIEIYNRSGRSNAVRAYHIWCQPVELGWKQMMVDRYTHSPIIGDPQENKIYNHTPVVLAPYSGVEALVQGTIVMCEQPDEMNVKVIVEDLFGKHYELIVVAVS